MLLQSISRSSDVVCNEFRATALTYLHDINYSRFRHNIHISYMGHALSASFFLVFRISEFCRRIINQILHLEKERKTYSTFWQQFETTPVFIFEECHVVCNSKIRYPVID